MKFLSIIMLSLLLCIDNTYAQSASQTDAKYLATLAAVINVKINDKSLSEDLDKLRENQNFMQKLQKKINRLSNEESSNALNRRVLDLLQDTGKQLDRML